MDLLLSGLLAGLAANAIQLLQTSGADTPKAQQKLQLLQLELGVRVGDCIALLEATSVFPGTQRKLWWAPSPIGAILASALSATCATSAVAIKKWPALTEQPKKRAANGGDKIK